MTKYAVALLAGCLYIAGASWLVRAEGRAHRDLLAKSDPEPVPGPPGATPPHPHPPRKPKVEPTPANPAPALADTAPGPQSTADRPPPVQPPAVPDSGPKPSSVRVQPPPSEPPQLAFVKPQPAPPPREWADSLDLAHLSREQEARLGQDLHVRVITEIPVLDEGDFLEQVEKAAAPFVEKGVRPDARYKFTVLNSDAVNAFSHPGGDIYVCRGVFDLIAEGEEPILEFIVGHEIAHLELRHAVKLIQRSNVQAKAKGISTLRQFELPLIMAYPDDSEYEADAWAYQKMILHAGRSPHEAQTFLKRFKTYAQRMKFPSGHKEPEAGSIAFENHFRAHPAAFHRLDRLKTLSSPAEPER